MFKYERRTHNDISFHEDEVKLAKTMMDKLRTTVEFLYYLMEHRGKLSFTMIMLSTDDLKLEHLLQKWKRKTDVLIEIDKINNVYVIICQSTDKEGGKKFAEILMSNITMHGGTVTYCVEAELTSTEHSIQEVIFNMVEKYIYIKQEQKSNQVFFTKFQEKVKDEDRDVMYHNSF
ncbi:MAG TPA: hypothetical protein ENK39_08635 [Epsilonproteobacteria bacterium]|nr:hypothetical protein [Campylobacterota bacterium]